MKNLLLRMQLRRQGATREEAKALAEIANKIGVSTSGLIPQAKSRIARGIGFKQRGHRVNYRLVLGGSFAALAIMVVVAQSALPGSPLYALKRGSEEVRTVVEPGFNDDDLRQRREIEQRKIQENQEREDNHSGRIENSSGADTSGKNTQENSGDNQQVQEQKIDNSGPGSTHDRTSTDRGSDGSGSGSHGGGSGD
jgi:hypothetical protein